MGIKEEGKSTYKFHNPADTSEMLYGIIRKEGQYEFNKRKNREERRDWWYKNKPDFLINPNLIFGKLSPYSDEDDDKDKYLKIVIEETEKMNNSQIVDVILKRYQKGADKLRENGFQTKSFALTLSWRMVIGLGASHPQETSMTLHHIYGIPYIPGSAVKGVTRHWVILSKFANNEIEAEKDSEFQRIFGTQEKKGEVIFFDAYPAEKINLKIDIMNPHYPEYYSQGKEPADWQNPNPIKFLTVEKTKFQFFIASRDYNLLNQTEKDLKKTLTQFGIGAKTSLGYGIFGD